MKKSKSYQAFRSTVYACRKSIDEFGYEVNPNGKPIGYDRIDYAGNVSLHMLTEVSKHLTSYRRDNDIAYKYEVIDAAAHEKRIQVANMVESTIENHRRALAAC